jgi:hypothetical protein
MPTYPESPAPYISVVVAARNDDHGGNMIGRMQAFIDSWISQSSRYALSSEIIVVEWNPPADRARLRNELRWPEDMGPCEVRFIEVSREIHDRLPNAATIPLHQMIAKNAGIRRARGQFVLATNLDIIFSAELMQFLGERRLERGKMYRMDRTDVASNIPAGATVDELLAFCKSHMRRIFAREGVMQLSGNGRRVLEDEDIVEPGEGIWFGSGWHAIEKSDRRPYRWAEPEAEIVFERPPEAAPRLLMDAEVGPSAGGWPLVVEVVSPSGRVLTSAKVDGTCKLRLHIPDHLSSGTLRLRLQGRKLPLARTPRFLMLRVFGLKWEVLPKWLAGVSLVRGTQSAREATALVRSAESRTVQVAIRPGPDSGLETVEVNLTDPAGNVVFHAGDRLPAVSGNQDEAEYLLSLNLGFKLSGGPAGGECASDIDWLLEVLDTKPPVDWTLYPQAPAAGAAHIAHAAFLHISACGDFTLLSREDWFALRAYAEFPIWPMNIDLLFCYAAHHAGIGEVVLREPMRVYHIEHLSAAGWSPEGEEERAARIEAKGVTEIQFATATEWIDRMRRFNAPMIFTLKDWGLAGMALPETTVQAGD